MEIRLLYSEGHQCYYVNTETGIYQADNKDMLITALMEKLKQRETLNADNDSVIKISCDKYEVANFTMLDDNGDRVIKTFISYADFKKIKQKIIDILSKINKTVPDKGIYYRQGWIDCVAKIVGKIQGEI